MVLLWRSDVHYFLKEGRNIKNNFTRTMVIIIIKHKPLIDNLVHAESAAGVKENPY